MSQIILHHYPLSPFAEKVRLILGYKQLSWQSVHIPMYMPKPDVIALTGGHRRTPFMQIGADIYCDSNLIADVLEQMQPTPTLYPEAVKGAARIVAQWADTLVFPVAMAYNFQPAGAAYVLAKWSPEDVKVFVQDRATMRGGAPRMPPADAIGMYKSYLRRLSHMLEQHPFLMDDVPSVADFAAYHPTWYTLRVVPLLADIFNATPNVRAWLERMEKFGHGTHTDLSSTQALQIAHDSQPVDVSEEPFMDHHGIALGSQVVITAESFGLEPTAGELVAATRTRYTVRRTDERAGTVHVHFPRNGFILKKAD
ncbi:glutathione S-transferase [Limnohabitans sp. TS-CS-82]|uniref:glutathione S-transferase family protein n=1 Tax=Limnohabitans sp. TS-CS-82 TaxID=2094193 RepID=UPI000CF1DBA2|nr:glutathione S-transferase family protein [Limnohabitans sp. TS-CS-82]PQA82837.1 glutathione S-transferase [Limnohabitans sp. TS-CS-82]